MRPLLLEIEGFGAFRDPVSIDFDDTSFFALVGPTGSGKSTVIDAVCFALYGNVPRYDDARMVAPAISIGALEAKVRLTFELAGMRYVAARVVRRSGARVTTKEARLERLGDHPAVLAGTTTELAPAVEALVGLSFEHFTRCVVLPQGEFARFLHDKPADRQELLVRLLDLGVYERMAQTANRRAKEHELAADLVDHQTTTLIAHDDAALSAAETRAGELAALAAKVAAAEPELARLDAALAAVATAQQAADAIVTALASVVVPPDVRRRGELLSAARRDAQRAEAGHGRAEAALVTAVGQSEVGPDGASLAAQLEIHRRIERGVVKRGEVLAAVETAVRAAAATQEVLSRAERRADAARVALEAGRDLHAAHTLRRHLDEGGVCPVCEQQVTHVPRSDPPLALAAAEQAEAAAAAELKAARHTAQAAGEARAKAQAEQAHVDRLLTELREQVADAAEPAVIEAQLAVADAAQVALAEARSVEQTARAAASKARVGVASVQAQLDADEHDFHLQRDPLVAVGAPAPGPDLLASWDALASWASARVPDELARQQTATQAAHRAAGDRKALADALVSSVAEAGLSAADGQGGLTVVVARAEADAAHRVQAVHDARAQALELAARSFTHRDEGAVAKSLALLLSARGFPRWLVAEAMAALVERASATLRSLSAGQYSLAADDNGELWVVDHRAADERRSVRTLSGGETFQASLALALALADELGGRAVGRVAGGGAPLEAIFLDEGFGTLDAESLETVASTIESLGDSGRMVGIVTHMPALAERVPVRYVVTKGPRTSTVVREIG